MPRSGGTGSWADSRCEKRFVCTARKQDGAASIVKNVAGNDAKWVDVAAERFPGWIDSFARRHGDPEALAVVPGTVPLTFAAADGTTAECHPPFGESFAVPSGVI